MVVNVLLVFCN